MRTEPSADRMRRRLSGELDPSESVDADADTADQPDDTSLSRWLPDTAGGGSSNWVATIRADPGRAGVIGLGVVGLAAVLVTIFTLARPDQPRVAAAKLPAVQPVSAAGPASATAPASAPQPTDAPVVVSVVGLVRTPGLVTLTPGARTADALAAAGGALDRADTTGLNMARRVTDGEQIVVGIAAPAGVAPVMGSSVGTAQADATGPPESPTSPPGGAVKPTAPLDLNAATAEQLDALPGVGPVTATAIVAWRTANGRFGNVDQLAEVDGIGPARLEKLRTLVRV